MATEMASQPPAAPRETNGGRTIGALWRDAVAQAGSRSGPAYLVERDGAWEEVSWDEAATTVDDLANGLLALGVRKGDAFAIVGRTAIEWALFDFALALVGAIGSPIYPSSPAKEVAYILDLSDAIGALVEDDEQLAKVEEARQGNDKVRHVLTFAGLEELRARGREYAAANPDALAEAIAAVGEDDLFTYIYTSGTTGPPKACMIRHRNYFEMVTTVDMVERFLVPEDLILLYLPLAHNFGRLIHLLAAHIGCTTAFCPDPLRVGEVLPQVRPTILPTVPRVLEKVHTAVGARFAEATGPKRKLIDWSLGVGKRVSRKRENGEKLPLGLALRHRLADRLVYSKVKDKLGGRLRAAISGGAPLSQEIAEYFHTLDILVLEGYGLTECTTACSVNRPNRFRFGSVGPPLPGFEVRIADDGEIMIRSGTVFAGYYKEDEATREVLTDDGWLHSGDIGEIDADGFLRVTDRKKDIIVTAGGKNVAPQNMENELKASPYVSQALVVGDKRPYLVALVTLDEGEIAKWAAGQGLEGDLEALASSDEVRGLIQSIVDDANASRASFEQIKRFAVLPRDFSAEHDEITPTMKLRRKAVVEHFGDEIDALYAAART